MRECEYKVENTYLLFTVHWFTKECTPPFTYRYILLYILCGDGDGDVSRRHYCYRETY